MTTIPARSADPGKFYLTPKGRRVQMISTDGDQVAMRNEGGGPVTVRGDYPLVLEEAVVAAPAKRAVVPADLMGRGREEVTPGIAELDDPGLLELRHKDTRMWVVDLVDKELARRMGALAEIVPATLSAELPDVDPVDWGGAREEATLAAGEGAEPTPTPTPTPTPGEQIEAAAAAVEARKAGPRGRCPRCNKEVATRVTGELREHMGAERTACKGAGRTVVQAAADLVDEAKAKVAVGGVHGRPDGEILGWLREAHAHVANGTGSRLAVGELLRNAIEARPRLHGAVHPLLEAVEQAGSLSVANWDRIEAGLKLAIEEYALPAAGVAKAPAAEAAERRPMADFVEKPRLASAEGERAVRIAAGMKRLGECMPFVLAARECLDLLARDGVAIDLGVVMSAGVPAPGGVE